MDMNECNKLSITYFKLQLYYVEGCKNNTTPTLKKFDIEKLIIFFETFPKFINFCQTLQLKKKSHLNVMTSKHNVLSLNLTIHINKLMLIIFISSTST